MKHIEEDQLTAYALDTLESESERQEIAAHLASCEDCRLRLGSIEADVRLMSNIRPRSGDLRMPSPRRHGRPWVQWLRTAAILVTGISIGYGASMIGRTEPAPVSPAFVQLLPPADSVLGTAALDATGVSAEYYKRGDLP